jgi:ABC-type antimicrobial peptide transport system permease subunit
MNGPSERRLLEVVGVVEDVKNEGIQRSAGPHVYVRGAGPSILVRASAGPMNLVDAIRSEIAAVDRGVALSQPFTLEELLDRFTYAQPRFSLIVLSVFAFTGTVLVAIGVLSVMAYTVTSRTREIAVRVALGARRVDVLAVVMGSGARLLAVGIAAGLALSTVAARLIAREVSNTSPQDPLTMAAAVAIVAAVSLAACYIPARRAIRVDPIEALRSE